MKNRIISASSSDTQTGVTSFETSDSAFASTLITHSIFCDWSGENWRWYINYLEEAFQNISRRILAVPVDHLPSPTFRPLSRKLTDKSVLSDKTRLSFGSKSINPSFQRSGIPIPLSPLPSFASGLPEPHEQSEPPPQQDRQHDIVFSDLQRMQFIKEKAEKTVLVLKVNMSVLSELRHHYLSIIRSESCPDRIRTQCQKDVARFGIRVTSVGNDMRMQQWRLETLLSLIADRNALLHGILQHRNTEANKELAEKSQQSADNIETMTEDMQNLTKEMHTIAQKTKQETISMKIITLVTLFFLPGTFISTLMSTDIIRFAIDASTGITTKTVSIGALQLYSAISIPLTLTTFAAGYGLYRWVKRTGKPRGDNTTFNSVV
ncbi:MAG: hypothetical protein Q9187_001162 [Circinaria calcarea]